MDKEKEKEREREEEQLEKEMAFLGFTKTRKLPLPRSLSGNSRKRRSPPHRGPLTATARPGATRACAPHWTSSRRRHCWRPTRGETATSPPTPTGAPRGRVAPQADTALRHCWRLARGETATSPPTPTGAPRRRVAPQAPRPADSAGRGGRRATATATPHCRLQAGPSVRGRRGVRGDARPTGAALPLPPLPGLAQPDGCPVVVLWDPHRAPTAPPGTSPPAAWCASPRSPTRGPPGGG